jgi:hypothetical protein
MSPLWHLDIVNVTPGRKVADYLVERLPDGRTAGVFGHRRDQGSELLVRNALSAILGDDAAAPRQQVPSRILDLLHPRYYYSTACLTEKSLRDCRDPRLLALVRELGFGSVSEYANEFCKSCRRTDKYIAEQCGCPSHAVSVSIPV